MEIARLVLEYLKAFLNAPVIAGCVVIFALIRYESALKTFVQRKFKVSLPGGSAFEIESMPPQQEVRGDSFSASGVIGVVATSEGQRSLETTEDTKGLDKLLENYVSPLIPELEDKIRKGLDERQITKPADREKTLLMELATTHLLLAGERLYQNIWRSQIDALRFVNGFPDSVDKLVLHPFYEEAKTKFPDWYTNKSFDDWLGFMVATNLLRVDNQKISITVAGREFLKFLATAAKMEKPFG